jgi:hypothetical protein
MRTLVALLLNLKLLCQVLFFFPLDGGADCPIVHKISRVSDLILVEISLLQFSVLEELVSSEDESELKPRLGFGWWEISQSDINEVLQSSRITICDNLRCTNVVPKGGEPELWDGGSLVGVLRQWVVIWVILE